MPRPTSVNQPSNVPSYEVFPMLVTPDYIRIMARLRELRQIKDELFGEGDPKKGIPPGEFESLKLEAGAMTLMALVGTDVKTVSFIDLKITVSEGGTVRGKIRVDALLAANVPAEKIAAASTGVDEEKLVGLGVAPHVIAGCRDADSTRAGSTKLEWVKEKEIE